MIKYEKEGLIKIRMILPWNEDLTNNINYFNDMNDEVYISLLKLYLASDKDDSEQKKLIIEKWNILRAEVLRIFLIDLLSFL